MTKWLDAHCSCEQIFMYACFGLAFVAASVAAIALIDDCVITEADLSIAGIALGTTGVWIALAFFVYQDRKRKESDKITKSKLKKILKAQKKCECRCQTDPVSE